MNAQGALTAGPGIAITNGEVSVAESWSRTNGFASSFQVSNLALSGSAYPGDAGPLTFPPFTNNVAMSSAITGLKSTTNGNPGVIDTGLRGVNDVIGNTTNGVHFGVYGQMTNGARGAGVYGSVSGGSVASSGVYGYASGFSTGVYAENPGLLGPALRVRGYSNLQWVQFQGASPFFMARGSAVSGTVVTAYCTTTKAQGAPAVGAPVAVSCHDTSNARLRSSRLLQPDGTPAIDDTSDAYELFGGGGACERDASSNLAFYVLVTCLRMSAP
ncbi:MAG: hypothetical protein SFW67_08150 [Myxococcaceae bacterium]|nr:hypothetical protein [Myxococcaceae bacterium]